MMLLGAFVCKFLFDDIFNSLEYSVRNKVPELYGYSAKPFSTLAISGLILTSSLKGFQYLHLLDSHYHLSF